MMLCWGQLRAFFWVQDQFHLLQGLLELGLEDERILKKNTSEINQVPEVRIKYGDNIYLSYIPSLSGSILHSILGWISDHLRFGFALMNSYHFHLYNTKGIHLQDENRLRKTSWLWRSMASDRGVQPPFKEGMANLRYTMIHYSQKPTFHTGLPSLIC